MLRPSLFGESLLDDFFDDMPLYRNLRFREPADAVLPRMMHTDVKELEQGYEIAINLPGFKKEDVQAELKDGYLTISASTNTSSDTEEDEGKYIRRERFSGSCSRRFYVGTQISEEDIKARFEDGVLRVDVPKPESKPAVEEKHVISIEG